tara:strand:- start:294 stop:500 length:207 start_codon:yes stop_codon:yes gene_type:complete
MSRANAFFFGILAILLWGTYTKGRTLSFGLAVAVAITYAGLSSAATPYTLVVTMNVPNDQPQVEYFCS